MVADNPVSLLRTARELKRNELTFQRCMIKRSDLCSEDEEVNLSVEQSGDTGVTPLYLYSPLTHLLCPHLSSTYVLTLLPLVPCCNSTFFPVSRPYKNGLHNCFLPKQFGKSPNILGNKNII